MGLHEGVGILKLAVVPSPILWIFLHVRMLNLVLKVEFESIEWVVLDRDSRIHNERPEWLKVLMGKAVSK